MDTRFVTIQYGCLVWELIDFVFKTQKTSVVRKVVALIFNQVNAVVGRSR